MLTKLQNCYLTPPYLLLVVHIFQLGLKLLNLSYQFNEELSYPDTLIVN